MRVVRFALSSCAGLLALAALAGALPAQKAATGQYPANLLGGLEWRDVGPMRGGRAYAVAGSPQQPDTFYMGSVGGGVWKTDNAGRTWYPIADQGIPIGSIGAIAVAPSDANVVYVGTGEPDIRSQHSYGIGVFKSTDAGKTWKSIGLEDSRQIGRIVVDPANPNLLYVAALGHVYDANPTRGVYRSADGGAHWKQGAERPAAAQRRAGAVDLALDPVPIRGRSTPRCGAPGGRRGRCMRRPTCRAAGCSRATDGGEHLDQARGRAAHRQLRRQDRDRGRPQQSRTGCGRWWTIWARRLSPSRSAARAAEAVHTRKHRVRPAGASTPPTMPAPPGSW